MKNELLEALIRVVTGLSGGAAALWLFWTDDSEEKKIVSKKRAIGFLVLGVCGSFFIAPAINEHFEFSGGIASSISFLCAVFSDALLVFIWKFIKSLTNKVDSIRDKFMGKWK